MMNSKFRDKSKHCLPVYSPVLICGCEIWAMTEKEKILDTSAWHQFPLQGGWTPPYRCDEELGRSHDRGSVTWEEDGHLVGPRSPGRSSVNWEEFGQLGEPLSPGRSSITR